MDKLFNLIIASTIYATVTGVFILIVKLLLKDKLTPKWTYILWLIFIIKLIIPFGPESDISIFNKIKINSQYANTLKYGTNENMSSSNIYSINKLDLNNSNLQQSNYLNEEISLYKGENISMKILNFATLTWSIVFTVLILTVSISYLKLLYKLKSSKTTSIRINTILGNSKKRCGILNDISLIINDEVDTPAILGLIKPKILFPTSLAHLNDKEIELIFLHELCHYKRKDNYLCKILLLLQITHWFNPFILCLFKIIRQDIELATDYKVAQIIDSNELKAYGLTLLKVLSNMNNKNPIPTLIQMVNDKKDIEERIMNIKNISKLRKNKIILTLVGLLTVSAVSPLVLTNASNKIAYANGNYSSSINKKYLSLLQSKFFDISKLLESKEDCSIEDVEKILEGTNYLRKIGNKGDFEVIYKYENEEIVLYNKTRSPYKIIGVDYKIYNPNKDVLELVISSESNDNLGWNNLVKISSTSVNKINDLAIKLNTKISKDNLFKDYNSVINEAEKGNKLNNKKLLSINSNLQKIYGNVGVSYYQSKLNNYELTISHINKSGDFENMSLVYLDKNGEVLEHINTLNISQSDSNIVRDSNISKDILMLHSLYTSTGNLDNLKELLLKSLKLLSE